MKSTIRFYQSVNFKIVVAFILLLLISIELIGNYFIHTLEKENIESFKQGIDPRVEQLAGNISNDLSVQNHTDEVDAQIQKQLSSFPMSNTLEVRVVDERGIIRAATGNNAQAIIGKKNDYRDLNDFAIKHIDSVEGAGRVYINVQPVTTSTGNAIVGAVYVKSDIEVVYKEIRGISVIFLTSSLIGSLISCLVAFLISKSITKPIEEIREAAGRITRGDYSGKLLIRGKDELSQLGNTFNQLSERIEMTQETIESDRNRLNSVLSHMTDGVISTDRRGKVMMINEMAMSLLNVQKDTVIGTSILDLLKLDDKYSLRQILEENPEILVEVAGRDEEYSTLHVEFAIIRRESGFISGLVVVLHDVTEQTKIERERQEFVSNVSHELRTPLTSMKSYLEALSDGAYKDEEVAESFLSTSLEEANRMMRMITDLLNLSRMDSGHTTLKKEFINFNDFVSYVLDRFDMMKNSEETGKKYVIKREFTPKDLWVEIDTDRMMQVIDNIMNNALKYSPDGGMITVRLTESQNNVLLSIHDQGLGIPKKDVGKIFERFYRVDKARARKQGGTGLGLAIAKEVVTSHGGQIWADSKLHVGSTFYIALPYEPYEEEWGDEFE
ncbi:two-component system, OmpR family, sensor histidine kinase VicK [Pilibacter termitis]|uniref:histidine kinase n=1 Tax=Pilibacter termitis TaxID=263852 RepID=A0A1T4KMN1_9ENTE|nr:cell wall metabolism sensor histidine kinase WalK [Pilibacter termitis]SJZ43647.1 two-component system, OmpR family, sensor histidine kinase VicK [Pilibacter termitis]